MLHSSLKQMITGSDSNISVKCTIQKYYLELRRKLKAYTRQIRLTDTGMWNRVSALKSS